MFAISRWMPERKESSISLAAAMDGKVHPFQKLPAKHTFN